MIHQPHDKGYKYILTIKQEFPKLLKGFIKEKWVDTIKEENIVYRSLLIDTSQIGDEAFLKQKSVISLVMYLDKAKSFEDFLKKYPIIAMIFNFGYL